MAFFGGGGASVDLASPPAIGNTTPNTGAFTTVESTSRQFITTANGSVQLGRSGGNALGTDAINIQPSRSAVDKVASGASSVAIGKNSKAGTNSICISSDEATAGLYAISIGMATTNASGQSSIAMGYYANGVANRSVAIGEEVSANNQGEFKTRPFGSVFYNAQTTNNTATTMTIDGAAGTRFTIPANTAIMADLFIIARRSDTVDKWFSSRRMVAIRRNNANGTAIIGSVQTIGTDQTEGSPTWSVAVTADDTNEALQIQVTGETGETVQWRVLALYRFV